MQGLTLVGIIATEKRTLMLGLTQKLQQSHWSMKCRLRALDHSACLKGMLRTITIRVPIENTK